MHFYFSAFGATLQILETANTLRKLTLPFSWLYGGFMSLRNWFFDKKLTRSFKFDFPVICVGNLSTGGTGKTPHIEFIISLLQSNYKLGVVSRGYGRKTIGFFMVDEDSQATDVGDEPLQIKQNNPQTAVAVGEQRIIAIPTLINEAPHTQVVLLDDAYQHRYVQAGMYILLSDYSKMFYDDMVLPAGNLREFKSGYKRADIIIVTKCPINLGAQEKQAITKRINPLAHQQVLFSYLQYGQPYALADKQPLADGLRKKDVLFFAGIANAKPINEYLTENANSFELVKLPDHVDYTTSVLDSIKKTFETLKGTNKILLTTQKDAVKLAQTELKETLAQWPIYVLPLEIDMQENDKQHFVSHIETYIQKELSITTDTK